ncbi:hypothetical protein BDY19DRAFT_988740 [Irpex rosettiformis]|uniref:Uncharacterized protein n=1 Tax=Irpex rosettiformis TaxID=378272 RepID=A0ACB8ULE7_9APHY|nr:hypothetical protein BDY19DRAFT_988740 [Irpex rosettiformis]
MLVRWPMSRAAAVLAAASLLVLLSCPAYAQDSSTASLTPSVSLSLTTATQTIQTTISSGRSSFPVSTVIPVVFNVTVTPTASSSAAPLASSSAPPDPRRLDTRIDPGFGVLGAILILTGIPSAFLGHKNRWTSFFLIGFYTLSLVCLCLILRFGVLQAVNPPSTTLRGLFVLACTVAGIAGGGVTIFFWKATKYFIGAWGGLAFGLWIQCFRDGGLIHPVGFRWIMYLGCAVVGFILCTINPIHYYIIIVSTAFVGATAFMLGVDCFSTAGVKEFYIWNLGFDSLFSRYQQLHIQFPVSQTMEIELGLLGAVAIMGIALQLRILKILQRKLSEIKAEHARLDEEQVVRAADRFATMNEEKAEWEHDHPTLGKHGRQDSTMSSTLLKDTETAVGSPDVDEKRHSTLSLAGISPRPRYLSGVSSLMGSTPVDGRQSPGAIPALDLGVNLESDVPRNYLADGKDSEGNDIPRPRYSSGAMSLMTDLEDLKEKERLLNEIQTIRKSLDLLKSETPAPSTSGESRRQSFSSRRTLSHDFGAIPLVGPSSSRPQTTDPRARVHSMDLLNRESVASVIDRPTSVPLQGDAGWEAYVADRRLFTPPSGITALIPTSPLPLLSPTPRAALSPAITEALLHRQQRETSIAFGRLSPVPGSTAEQQSSPISPKEKKHAPRVRSPEDLPIALRPQSHVKSNSQESYAPGIILPPHHRNVVSPPPQSRPDPARVLSFEELDVRHREHLRQLQQPVTEAEREHAEILAARSRWERAKEFEKQAVTKRQAERAAAVNKQVKEQEKQRKSTDVVRQSINLNDDPKTRGHQRSLSADILAAAQPREMSRSSRRYSMMKVEDWQKHQLEDTEIGRRPRERPSGSQQKRESSAGKHSAVPFPEVIHQRPSREGKQTPGRDPVN